MVAFDIKGSMLSVSTIFLNTIDLDDFEVNLNKMIADSPNLFVNMPVLIDLSKLNSQSAINFDQLKSICQSIPMIVIGLRQVPHKWAHIALSVGWNIVASGKNLSNKRELNRDLIKEEPISQKIAPQPANYQTSTLKKPVRSGQQVCVKGDIILLKTVSEGAEIVASGNIHAYGKMKGKLFAGFEGDQNAQIFCQNFHAELVSIAGNFKVFDQIASEHRGKSVRIYLQDERIQIEPLE